MTRKKSNKNKNKLARNGRKLNLARNGPKLGQNSFTSGLIPAAVAEVIRPSVVPPFRLNRQTIVTDIVVGNNPAFTLHKYRINPGDASAFIWLSKLAANFEKYEFHSLCYSFRPLEGTQNQGAVVLAVDWDVADEDPFDKFTLLQYEGAVRGSIWAPFNAVQKRSCFGNIDEHYIRHGARPAGTDPRFYDIGNLYVGVTDTTAAPGTIIGELWVSFDVSLITPQIEPNDMSQGDFAPTVVTELNRPFHTPTHVTMPTHSGDMGLDFIDGDTFQLHHPASLIKGVFSQLTNKAFFDTLDYFTSGFTLENPGPNTVLTIDNVMTDAPQHSGNDLRLMQANFTIDTNGDPYDDHHLLRVNTSGFDPTFSAATGDILGTILQMWQSVRTSALSSGGCRCELCNKSEPEELVVTRSIRATSMSTQHETGFHVKEEPVPVFAQESDHTVPAPEGQHWSLVQD